MQLDFEDIQRKIQLEYGIYIHIGIEREFYCAGISWTTLAEYFSKIARNYPLIKKISKEQSDNQFEYNSGSTICIADLVKQEKEFQEELMNKISSSGSECFFKDIDTVSGKIFNGLHINISLHDERGANLYSVMNGSIRSQDNSFVWCMSGLLETMRDLTLLFAPTAECYGRFCPSAFPNFTFTPCNVSWGVDNRTTALRIPPVGNQSENRRIEHRVSNASADLAVAVTGVFLGLEHGLHNQNKPSIPQVFGYANDPRLSLMPLPKTLLEAREIYEESLLRNRLFK